MDQNHSLNGHGPSDRCAYYRASELAILLGVSVKLIYKLADLGELPVTPIGGRTKRFPKRAVHELLESKTHHPRLRRKRTDGSENN